ncbi:Spy/CpxP family protein refolding chaperone [Mariniflexile sp. HMF6888]|uniref:Spy/CpxP family protein refolding chaperone n=1 Tax=Mariniflexile sp. HMF6888 TaxID=3373086 RepID=UPI00378BC487
MKKNAILYTLLVFLIIVNGFFLFNYIGTPVFKETNEQQDPDDFIARELQFNESQMQKMHMLSREHHHKIRQIHTSLRTLKNALFKNISVSPLNTSEIDSISNEIGFLEKERDIATFYNLREVYNLCNEKQKERFNEIVTEALHKVGEKKQRPPIPHEENGRMLPPPHPNN